MRDLQIIFATILLGAVLYSTGCSTEPDVTAANYIGNAKLLMASGQVPAAIIELKNALQLEPDSAEGRLLLGSNYLKLREGALAQTAIERVPPDYPGRRAALLRALLLQGEYERVSNESAGANKDPTLLTIRGEANLGLSDIGVPEFETGNDKRKWRQAYVDIAKGLFDQALAIDPSDYRAHLGLVRAALWEGDFERAATVLDAAETLEPTDPVRWILRGMLSQFTGRHSEAEIAYKRALDIAPYDVVAKLNLTRVLLTRRKSDDAFNLAVQLIREHPKLPNPHYLKAHALLRKKEPDKALVVLHDLLRDFPSYVDAELLLGRTLIELDKLEQAHTIISGVLSLYPEYPPAQRALAQIELNRGNARAAIRALKLLPDDDVQTLALLGKAYDALGSTSRASWYLGQAEAAATQQALEHENVPNVVMLNLLKTHLKNNDNDKALEIATRLEARNPDDEVAYYFVALAYLASGDHEAARAAFTTSLKQAPNFVASMMRLAAIEGLDGHPEKAKELYHRVLGLDDNNIEALLNIARIEDAEGRRSKANEHLQRALVADQENPATLLALAKLAHGAGDQTKMFEYLERAAIADPHAIQPHILVARHSFDIGDFKRAQIALDKVFNIDRTHAGAMLLSSELAYVTGDKEKSLDTAIDLVTHYPDSADSQRTVAIAYLRTGDSTAARKALNRALEIEPEHALALSTLTSLEMNDSRYDAAKAAALRLIEVEPEAATGYKLFGDVLLSTGDNDDAITQYKHALAKPRGTTYIANIHGSLLRAVGETSAQTFLHNQVQRFPDDTNTLLVMAREQLRTGNSEEASSTFEKVLRINPDNTGALNDLAWLYHSEGRRDAAQLAERAYALRPSSVSIADTLGWILVEQGDPARGVEILRNAVAYAPGVTTIRYHLAAGLAALGQTEQAITELKTAVRDQDFAERESAQALLQALRGRSAIRGASD